MKCSFHLNKQTKLDLLEREQMCQGICHNLGNTWEGGCRTRIMMIKCCRQFITKQQYDQKTVDGGLYTFYLECNTNILTYMYIEREETPEILQCNAMV